MPIDPEQVAFLGHATVETPGNARVVAYILCAPTVPNAWSIVAAEWKRIVDEAGADFATPRAESNAMGWLRDVAPQLAAQFQRAVPAELAVANLIKRSAIRLVMALVAAEPDVRGPRSMAHPRHRLLAECLSLHQRERAAIGRSPCTLLFARSTVDGGVRSNRMAASVGEQLISTTWSFGMQLRFWNESIEPLPMELSHVMFMAAVRHVVHPTHRGPILDALVPKLSYLPPLLRTSRPERNR